MPQQFSRRSRINPLIRGHTGKGVTGHVANAIAAGLNGMHLHAGQFVQNIRDIDQFRPVKLYILAGGKVAIALVIGLGDVTQHAQLTAA